MTLDLPVSFVASVLAILVAACGLVMVWWRLGTSGWGPYSLQALGLILLLPTILILAAFDIVSDEIIATLLGGVAGYIFGRGADPEKRAAQASGNQAPASREWKAPGNQ
jgi:hypothetical protein